MNSTKLPADFQYLPELYADAYFPNFLVDKIADILKKLVAVLESNSLTNDKIQAAFDEAVKQINDLQEAFYENDSEIEIGARESIAETVERILTHFNINIDLEELLRERDW